MDSSGQSFSNFILEQQCPPTIFRKKKKSESTASTSTTTATRTAAAGGTPGSVANAATGSSATAKHTDNAARPVPTFIPLASNKLLPTNSSAPAPRNLFGQRVGTVVDHMQQLELEACACPHLQEYLPHVLKLDLAKAPGLHKRGWVLANPVHALHLETQLDADPTFPRPQPSVSAASSPASKSTAKRQPSTDQAKKKLSQKQKKPQPQLPRALYGDEQLRTMVLTSEGTADCWCPITVQSSIVDNPPIVKVQEETLKTKAVGSPKKVSASKSAMISSPTTITTQIEATKASPSIPEDNANSNDKSAEESEKTSLGQVEGKTKSSGSDDIKSIPEVAKSMENASTTTSTPPVAPPDNANSSVLPPVTTKNSSAASTPKSSSSTTGKSKKAKTRIIPVKVESVTLPDSQTSSNTSAADGRNNISNEANGDGAANQDYVISENRYYEIRAQENRIQALQRAASTRRVTKKKASVVNKRKREADMQRSTALAGWRPDPTVVMNEEEQLMWSEANIKAKSKIEHWLQVYRQCLLATAEEEKQQQQKRTQTRRQHSFYMGVEEPSTLRSCFLCTRKSKPKQTSATSKNSSRKCCASSGDEIMECLECSFTACSPRSVAPKSRQHMSKHLLLSGHCFAVTCGPQARVYCFKCGDFVYHPIFEQEKKRLALCTMMPSMAWKQHPVQRSFNAFQFMQTGDHGIVWRGLIASYPDMVPREHLLASELAMRRLVLFRGLVDKKWLQASKIALSFCAAQRKIVDQTTSMVTAPVGMYNLGNTCFQTAVLQCLVHCPPLQHYFLNDIGHHHSSCFVYRQKAMTDKKRASELNASSDTNTTNVKNGVVTCLACEMDRLFIMYYGSTIGKDMDSVLEDASRPLLISPAKDSEESIIEKSILRGEPLITSDLLTAAWNSGGMNHLAGYEQHDAHEFLHSFLDLVGKHAKAHRDRVISAVNYAAPDNVWIDIVKKDPNVTKRLFEGTLRSVLVCGECGEKRVMSEPFLNISLTLSEEVERLEAENRGDQDSGAASISVETCLEHFVLPEKLSDPVDCPNCKKKTTTKKQHTASKLPKVLCLHLKRFDAARNRKITNFVSFPAENLNMGRLLSHWCEVSTATTQEEDGVAEATVPYRLFGTVNHIGSMQSGHYVSNVKVKQQWFHCNDAHVYKCEESNVMQAEGAYLLFYIRD